MSRLKTNKLAAAGPDNCHPYVLFSICNGLVLPLTLLFNKTLEESTLPNSWKDVKCYTNIQEGLQAKLSNYLLVILTSVICKMLEAIIKSHLMEHLGSAALLATLISSTLQP